jgi:hypothetical protein
LHFFTFVQVCLDPMTFSWSAPIFMPQLLLQTKKQGHNTRETLRN